MDLADNAHVSEFTKKTLAQFGWQENDAIPVDLGPLLMQLKETCPKFSRTDVLIDINVIPEEGIEAVKQLLSAAKEVAAKRAKAAELNEKTKNMSPSVAALYKQLNSDTQESTAEIIDDRADEAAPAPSEPVTAAQELPKTDEQPQAAQAANPAEGILLDAPMVVMPYCGRCGWDNRMKFETPVTELDKQDFLASVLGNQRFKRDMPLMGGKLVITFRTPMAEENKLIFRQLAFDQQAKRIVTESEWFNQLIEYRLALSLEKLTDAEGKVLNVVPELSEFKPNPPPDEPMQTALVPMTEYVNNKVLAHEVTRRLVGQHLRQFQRLVEALEAMALEPSFWNGIE